MGSPLLPNLLTSEQAAAAIGVTASTLAVWRCTRRYPLAYIKAGRLIRYREIDVASFLNSRRVNVQPSSGQAPTSASRQPKVG